MVFGYKGQSQSALGAIAMGKVSVLVGMCLLAGGCASVGSPALRGAATDAPERFLLLDAATGQASPIPADATCESPLVDPRDGTKLTMERASGGMGDYSATNGKYGLAEDELLRVDCSTGVATGRVSR
jgi:hypothetical protein